jgi:hypothetical protein
MSKFADKLNRIYKSSAPALGFRKPSEETELPSILLLADLTKGGVKKAKSVADSGINAAVVSSESIDADNFKELVRSTGEVPLGLLLEEGDSQEKVQQMIDAGCDFIVFGLQAPLEAINKEGLGKVLKIEPSLTPGLIRAVNELRPSIDAVLIASDAVPITIERLLTCQLFTGLLNKPILVNVNSELSSGELNSLHETGVKGLILPEGTTPKVFAELKKTISSLPKTPKRKTSTGVLLPRISTQPETKVEKVEEEEEEEDI